MSTKRLLASAALGACLLVALVAGPTMAATAATSSPSVTAVTSFPQPAAARSGAQWLASQLTPQGYIPGNVPGQANLSFTANTVLALASTGVDPAGAAAALGYLESHVNQYVTVSGADGASQLALLILDAHAMGVEPTAFGGNNLVARLLATLQPSGLFGVQDPTYDGSYRQGLALAALAAAGVTDHTSVGSAETWLLAQQCPSGGWSSDAATNPCNGDPNLGLGADTNSTALAVEGLVAQDALTTSSTSAALAYLTATQDGDGGWGYSASLQTVPGPTDPNSTSVVIQALVALGKTPAAAAWTKSAGNPVSALVGFQLTTGAGKGGFFTPFGPTADPTASFQAVPALAGVPVPFEIGRGYWLVASDGGVFSYGDAAFGGSLGDVGVNDVAGMAR